MLVPPLLLVKKLYWFYNVYIGFLYFNIFKLILNINKTFHFNPKLLNLIKVLKITHNSEIFVFKLKTKKITNFTSLTLK